MKTVRHFVDGYSITHGVPEKVSHKGRESGNHRKIVSKKILRTAFSRSGYEVPCRVPFIVKRCQSGRLDYRFWCKGLRHFFIAKKLSKTWCIWRCRLQRNGVRVDVTLMSKWTPRSFLIKLIICRGLRGFSPLNLGGVEQHPYLAVDNICVVIFFLV